MFCVKFAFGGTSEACFEIFICYGGSIWTWNTSGTIALIVLSVSCVIAFGLQQYFTLLVDKANRLFPVHLLRSPENWAIFACAATGLGSIYIVVFFLPIFFQFAHSNTALTAGVKLLPAITTMSFAPLISGAVMGKLPLYLPWYALGGVMVQTTC